jgi:glyoxylase-like metal-dependent hydrolase (beta-lactamase superfamily II)
MPLTIGDRLTQIREELSEDRGFGFDWHPYQERIASHFREEPVLVDLLPLFHAQFTEDPRAVLTRGTSVFDIDFTFARAALNPHSLHVEWLPGSDFPATYCGPMLQAHGWDAGTYIFRQNPASNAEAPFVYLLIGARKALLIDTGAPSSIWPDLLYDTVTGLLTRSGSPQLMVTHTHRHADHCAADKNFKRWLFPAAPGSIDLGGRVVTALSTPGHSAADFTFYDDRTEWLLTGDLLYPGRLHVADWASYRASVDRLAAFSAAHPVAAILGSHIEMTREPGKDFKPHALELSRDCLLELHELCRSLGDRPKRTVRHDFILIPSE